MTAQAPERLINECAELDFGGRELFGLELIDEAGHRYDYLEHKNILADVTIPLWQSTGLYRNYIATYMIDQSRQVWLEEVVVSPKHSPETTVFNRKLCDDFYLEMKHFFFGPAIRIPVKQGHVVVDENEWLVEDQRLKCRCKKVIGTIGLQVDAQDARAFLPSTFLPEAFQNNLDALVGATFDGVVVAKVVPKRGPSELVVKPIDTDWVKAVRRQLVLRFSDN